MSDYLRPIAAGGDKQLSARNKLFHQASAQESQADGVCYGAQSYRSAHQLGCAPAVDDQGRRGDRALLLLSSTGRDQQ